MWKVLLFVKTLVYVLIFPRFLNSDSRFERKWDYKVGIKLSKEKIILRKQSKVEKQVLVLINMTASWVSLFGGQFGHWG